MINFTIPDVASEAFIGVNRMTLKLSMTHTRCATTEVWAVW